MAAIDDQILALQKAIDSPATSPTFLPSMQTQLANLQKQKATYSPPSYTGTVTYSPPAAKSPMIEAQMSTASSPVATVVKKEAVPISTISNIPSAVETASELIAPISESLYSKIRSKIPTWGVYVGIGITALIGFMVVRKILK